MTQVTLKIQYDECCSNPRENDNLTLLVLRNGEGDPNALQIFTDHVRDKLSEMPKRKRTFWLSDIANVDLDRPPAWWHGDMELDLAEEELDWEKLMFCLNSFLPKQLELFFETVWVYQHSGIAFRNHPFSCKWDSGFAGVQVVFWKDAIENSPSKRRVGGKAWLRETNAWVSTVSSGEIHEYSSWRNGDCYRFTLESEDGKLDESCGGFIGSHDLSGIKEYIPADFHAYLEDGEFEHTLEIPCT